MIKDYWIYQERECAQPWAIYVVRQDSRITGTLISVTIYSEAIGNDVNSMSFLDWHFNSVNEYVNETLLHICEFSEVWSDDREQLEREFTDILR